MTINPLVYASAGNVSATASNSSGGSAGGLSGMDGDAFMLLLMAQMRNQNPLEPMNEREMMGQVTSLNSLQELQSIKTSMEKMRAQSEVLYASSLIGKTVKYNTGSKEPLEGLVSAITAEAGEIMLKVGDDLVPLTTVTEVRGG